MYDAIAEAGAPYTAAFRRRWFLILAIPALAGATTLGLKLMSARTYVAKAAFVASEPASLSNSLGALSNVAAQLGVPGLSTLAQGSASGSPQFYADLLVSATELQAVVTTRFDAKSADASDGKPFSGTMVEYLNAIGPTETDRENDAMQRFVKNTLEVTADRPTGVVRFQVRTKNRKLSALVARRMLDLVNEFNQRRRQSQASAERDFARTRAAAARDTLDTIEAKLADFRASNIDFSHSPSLATREAQLQRRVALAQQLYSSVAQRYELANIEAVRNTPVITVLDAPETAVTARPRYVVATTLGVALAALVFALLLALGLERPARRA